MNLHCEHRFRCPECKDRLIHQENRGWHESGSSLGQFVHDKYPPEFYWMDIDAVMWKRMTRILRIVERKREGQELRDSQRAILPKLAHAVAHLIDGAQVDKASGVYVVEGSPPWPSLKVMGVSQTGTLATPVLLQGESLDLFLQGYHVPELGQSVEYQFALQLEEGRSR